MKNRYYIVFEEDGMFGVKDVAEFADQPNLECVKVPARFTKAQADSFAKSLLWHHKKIYEKRSFITAPPSPARA